MNYKILLITFILVIGFSFENCDICDCPDIQGEYFDIQDIALNQFSSAKKLEANDTLSFKNYVGLQVQYEVEYVSQTSHRTGFSLIPEANACSCVSNGEFGSKTEMLSSLKVITLNDFDAEHPANDTINDLLDIYNAGTQNLEQYLATNTGLIQNEFFTLLLHKAPELNKQFKAKIILKLSTGEVYEEETETIVFN